MIIVALSFVVFCLIASFAVRQVNWTDCVVIRNKMAFTYTRDDLLRIRASINHSAVLSWPVFASLRRARLHRQSPCHRGCRGGKNRYIPILAPSRHTPTQKHNSQHTFSQSGVNHANLIHIKPTVCPTRNRSCTKINLVNPTSSRHKASSLFEHILTNTIDLCFMTETWFKERDAVLTSALKDDVYNFKHCPRPGTRRGGGTGLVYNRAIKVDKTNTGEEDSFEFSEWKLTLSNGVVIDAHIIYRPPYSDAHPFFLSIY